MRLAVFFALGKVLKGAVRQPMNHRSFFVDPFMGVSESLFGPRVITVTPYKCLRLIWAGLKVSSIWCRLARPAQVRVDGLVG